MQPSDLIILSGATIDYEPATVSLNNHIRYAQISGHRSWVASADGFKADRPPAWYKILFLLGLQGEADWTFWIDADAVFVSPKTLTEFTETDRDIVVASDYNGINTGAVFVRSSAWSKTFLENVWDLGDKEQFRNNGWWEQSAFTYLYRTNAEVRERIEVVPHQRFNADPREGYHVDRVAHFSGRPDDKLRLLRQWANRI